MILDHPKTIREIYHKDIILSLLFLSRGQRKIFPQKFPYLSAKWGIPPQDLTFYQKIPRFNKLGADFDYPKESVKFITYQIVMSLLF